MLCKSLITVLPILGFQVTEHDLQEVTELSGVLEAPDDYIPLPYKDSLNALLPNPENVKSTEFVQTSHIERKISRLFGITGSLILTVK